MSDRRALLAASSGIGDVIRATPLVRVLAALGYGVDLLIEPDYPEVVSLLEGAPEIGTIYSRPSRWARERVADLGDIGRRHYDVAIFTALGAGLRSLVHADACHIFDRDEWMRDGDVACAGTIAARLGWSGPLPEPFAMASDRMFDLPPGTVALHPGCKPAWYWKKWHGFAELAERFPSVAVVGTTSDLENGATYFRSAFRWPAHARIYVGELSLKDTAALLGECAALISNDSGLMHLAVAMGRPTFGVFGITSPRREAIPSPLMVPITKGLPCEPACRAGRWGRKDCPHHLACLKTLTADDVARRVSEHLESVTGLESR